MKLDDKCVAALTLPPGIRDKVFRDSSMPFLGVRLRDNAAKTWVFKNRMPLGLVSAVKEKQARKMAAELYARSVLGHDPLAEKRAARSEAEKRAAETFEAIAALYLARKEKTLRPRSFAELSRHLMKNAAPLHRLALADIEKDRRAIPGFLAKLEHDRTSGVANDCRRALASFFAWAIREGIIDTNPVLSTNAPAGYRPRERTLDDAELRDVWMAAGDSDFGLILKLLMLTGSRRKEIGCLAWDEVDLDAAMISVPGERMKNGKPHTIPLSPPALEILRSRPRDSKQHVFGQGPNGFAGYGQAKAAIDVRIDAVRKSENRPTMRDWVIHDLRRTLSTKMHEHDIAEPHIVEAILAHAGGHRAGVAGVYNRAKYEHQKRQALDRWAEYLSRLIGA
jgi:integrase